MATTAERSETRGGILIVDDSGYARLHLREFLSELGFARVHEARDGDEALELFCRHRPALVVLDQVMRGLDGIGTARLMLARDPSVKIVMLTVVTDRALQRQARGIGVRKVVQKSDREALTAALHELADE